MVMDPERRREMHGLITRNVPDEIDTFLNQYERTFGQATGKSVRADLVALRDELRSAHPDARRVQSLIDRLQANGDPLREDYVRYVRAAHHDATSGRGWQLILGELDATESAIQQDPTLLTDGKPQAPQAVQPEPDPDDSKSSKAPRPFVRPQAPQTPQGDMSVVSWTSGMISVQDANMGFMNLRKSWQGTDKSDAALEANVTDLNKLSLISCAVTPEGRALAQGYMKDLQGRGVLCGGPGGPNGTPPAPPGSTPAQPPTKGTPTVSV